MDLLQHLSDAAGLLCDLSSLLTIFVGVAIGILIGAMPGLSPSMGVALVVPFTYAMSPTMGIVLLTSIYLAADYGGSITAVTINTPGTPAAVVTAYDGYALTRRGEAGLGLGVSLIASVMGGLIGTLILIFFARPLSEFALRFQPAEYFAIAIFGLTSVASVGGYAPERSLLMATFGLLLNTIGSDPISGVSRFTFGLSALYDGFALIPVLIGLFAVSEVCLQWSAVDAEPVSVSDGPQATRWPAWREYWSLRAAMIRSAIIGTLIGIFPGAGATVASFVAYDIEKRLSKTPDSFGQGNPAGVAAAEAANSSSVGGALIPLLTLGIPGSASAAVLIGALMIHDVVPGPRMLVEHPDVIYGLFVSLLIANVAILVLGAAGSRIWIRVTTVDKAILLPLILAAAVIGSFSVRYALFDVVSCLVFGIFGWQLRRNRFPVVPIVLGMVLGNLIEENLRQAILMDGYSFFMKRPKCFVILLSALLAATFPWLKRRFQNARTDSPS